ncbi:hypothetical protein K470DRAFT_269532 [Piedraia hortae CBS 480.64]|uniref:Uncharacterized protein n=1 Tax=Piedraia hortae CBS 480.64 TaxID=1314780 RepID=A0A6A7C415_9PEZI|nr:hypothetical protein K470DRAFT_269532 [Piedraia hortae CBS 480.64]
MSSNQNPISNSNHNSNDADLGWDFEADWKTWPEYQHLAMPQLGSPNTAAPQGHPIAGPQINFNDASLLNLNTESLRGPLIDPAWNFTQPPVQHQLQPLLPPPPPQHWSIDPAAPWPSEPFLDQPWSNPRVEPEPNTAQNWNGFIDTAWNAPVGGSSKAVGLIPNWSPSRGTGDLRFQCVKCVKKDPPVKSWYKHTPATGEHHCRRCLEAENKRRMSVHTPHWDYIPSRSGFMNADGAIYARWPSIELDDGRQDDWRLVQNQEEFWVRRFIHAVEAPFQQGLAQQGGEHDEADVKWLQEQQVAINKAQHEKSTAQWFTSEWVTTRLVMLFYAVLNLHRGGRRPYPQGGNNSGFGQIDKRLTCTERLRRVEHLLTLDKRIAINVIDGNHVNALAENPDAVRKRKTLNRKTNVKKAKLQLLGKQEMNKRSRELSEAYLDEDAADEFSD